MMMMMMMMIRNLARLANVLCTKQQITALSRHTRRRGADAVRYGLQGLIIIITRSV
jgi:hypothetical protein